jgi:regulator of nucleoside diphosphate kinase
MMSQAKFRISSRDMTSLRNVVLRASAGAEIPSKTLLRLQDLLETAVIVDSLPGDVVALGTKVLLRHLDSNRESVYTLSLPSEANIQEGTISVLAPLGAAILGLSVGEVFQFEPPSGVQTLRLEGILSQPQCSCGGADPPVAEAGSPFNCEGATRQSHPSRSASSGHSLRRRTAEKGDTTDGYRETLQTAPRSK